MNEIIVNLEGKEYQIDIQKAKELGVTKEKDTKCKSWDEFKLKYKNSYGYYSESISGKIYNPINPLGIGEQLIQQEAIAIQAFSKLLKLRRDWIGDWDPYQNIPNYKYCIAVTNNHFIVHCCYYDQRAFSFPTREIAQKFLEIFNDLFNQCKNLI